MGVSHPFYRRPRFQLLAGDISGGVWIVHESNDPREVFDEWECLERRTRWVDQRSDYQHLVVWDDQTDRQVADLDHALELLEEGGH